MEEAKHEKYILCNAFISKSRKGKTIVRESRLVAARGQGGGLLGTDCEEHTQTLGDDAKVLDLVAVWLCTLNKTH